MWAALFEKRFDLVVGWISDLGKIGFHQAILERTTSFGFVIQAIDSQIDQCLLH